MTQIQRRRLAVAGQPECVERFAIGQRAAGFIVSRAEGRAVEAAIAATAGLVRGSMAAEVALARIEWKDSWVTIPTRSTM